jgi:hypothetical protein
MPEIFLDSISTCCARPALAGSIGSCIARVARATVDANQPRAASVEHTQQPAPITNEKTGSGHSWGLWSGFLHHCLNIHENRFVSRDPEPVVAASRPWPACVQHRYEIALTMYDARP